MVIVVSGQWSLWSVVIGQCGQSGQWSVSVISVVSVNGQWSVWSVSVVNGHCGQWSLVSVVSLVSVNGQWSVWSVSVVNGHCGQWSLVTVVSCGQSSVSVVSVVGVQRRSQLSNARMTNTMSTGQVVSLRAEISLENVHHGQHSFLAASTVASCGSNF